MSANEATERSWKGERDIVNVRESKGIRKERKVIMGKKKGEKERLKSYRMKDKDKRKEKAGKRQYKSKKEWKEKERNRVREGERTPAELF